MEWVDLRRGVDDWWWAVEELDKQPQQRDQRLFEFGLSEGVVALIFEFKLTRNSRKTRKNRLANIHSSRIYVDFSKIYLPFLGRTKMFASKILSLSFGSQIQLQMLQLVI